jgi:hypothetical protein
MVVPPFFQGLTPTGPFLSAQGRFLLLPDGTGTMPVLHIFKRLLVTSPLRSFFRFPSHVSIPFQLDFTTVIPHRG